MDFTEAAKLCVDVWPRFMFTPLIMLEWLLGQTGQTWENFTQDADLKKKRAAYMKAIEQADETAIRHLWAENTGVCTSWAVFITKTLGNEWIFGNKQGHRAAWTQSGMAIDSSARNALDLSDGGTQTRDETSWVMRRVNTPGAVLCSGKDRLEEFKKLTGHLEAMKICLRQLIDRKGQISFFSLYRTVKDGKPRFDGAITWHLSKRESKITLSEVKKGTKMYLEAIFPAAGSSKGDQERIRYDFFKFNRKPSRIEQYSIIRHVFMRIFLASGMVYGEPSFEKETV